MKAHSLSLDYQHIESTILPSATCFCWLYVAAAVKMHVETVFTELDEWVHLK